MPLALEEYIKQATKQLASGLEARIKALAKEEREQQLYGAEKLQQAGRLTSGFRPDMIERVMDLFAGKRAEVRGEYDERALAVAQYLYNLAQEAEQAEMDRALQKLMQGKELSFREKELAQQAILTREGYALQKYLASLKGGGGKVSTTPTPVPIPTPAPKPAPTPKDVYEKQKSDYYLQQYAQQGWTQYKKPATTKTYSYQEELATPRTYKGLGGVIY